MNKFYTIKEVAEITSFAEGTIRNKISEGTIKSLKIAGGTRISHEELERFVGVKLKGE